MRLLHIGDFHYRSNKNIYDQNNIIKKLIDHLTKKELIDYVFFSGDLVFNGSKEIDFKKAHESLFIPLCDLLKIKIENVFICPGNHDIDRNKISQSVIEYLTGNDSKIRKNEDLEKWIEFNKVDLNSSIQSIQNYYSYSKENFQKDSIEFNEFLTIHERVFGDFKFAIVSINSSWLCSGFQDDKNNLLFPIEILKDAITKISCDYKILMLHHPLSYFKEFNQIELQDFIYKEFNLMFSGHVHKEKIETDFNSKNGIYSNTTHATLCFGDGEIGYSILNIDTNELHEIKLERAYYLQKENSFIDLEPVIITIPTGVEKYNQNKIRKKIIKKYETELDIANQLLLNYDGENKRAFLESFTNPVLSTRSDAESSSGNLEFVFNFEDLYKFEKSFLIFGKDKCGKTSLLKKIKLHHLKNYSYTGIIPFYLDYKDYENADIDRFSLEKELSNFYELNASDLKELINQSKLLLLIDNLNIGSPIHSKIVSFIQSHSNSKFIFCSEYIASRIFLEDIDALDYHKVYFKNLTRKEIRLYTKTNKGIAEDKESAVLDKITTICSQLQLPLNFWTISLILLIYKKNNDDYSKNLFSVLDACVDEILNKKRFLISKTDIKFEQYKSICSKIAYFLLTKHNETEYSADYTDILIFIKYEIKKNPRIVSDEKEIFDYLHDVGILKRKNNKYTFRLNGIFEYFLAYYIKEHPEFKDEVLSNDAFYLAFKNELELYSGFNRGDEEFLNKVLIKTKTKFDSIINDFNIQGNVDQNLMRKISDANEFSKNLKKLLVNSPIKHELQDQIKDQLNPLETDADVHVKEIIDTTFIDFELLEKYLSILSRVFKNLDTIENTNLIKEVFDYILDCYCHLGFYFIEEYENKAATVNSKNADLNEDIVIGEEVLRQMSRIIPVLMQSMLFDGIGHINLKRIVYDKISILKEDYKNNQYKLFLLYFLYIDLDVDSNKAFIEDIFKVINLPPLKIAILFKLNFYLAFKAYKQPKLEEFFKNKIQEVYKIIDNKTDVNDMQKFLSDKQKRNLSRRFKK